MTPALEFAMATTIKGSSARHDSYGLRTETPSDESLTVDIVEAVTRKTSIEPSWVETTLRWIDAKGLGKDGAVLTKGNNDRLVRFLVHVKYHRHEMINVRKFSELGWLGSLRSRVEEWSKPKHAALVAFLESGGYSALLEKEKKSKSVVRDEYLDGDMISSGTISSGKIEWGAAGSYSPSDSLSVDKDGRVMGMSGSLAIVDELVDQEIQNMKPKDEQSPEKEMQEILDQALREQDPRFGVW
jgi:hypothetical protein